MGKQPTRTITLLDAIVLVASTAIGFAWVRCNWSFETFDWPKTWILETPAMLAPLLLTWTLAIAVLRLVPPRPPMRRLVLQPGAAACGSVVFGFAVECLSSFGILFARTPHIRWFLFRGGCFTANELLSNAVDGVPYHSLVMVVWGLLFLSRRCRPEASWIDRVGRAIGVSWILLGFWLWLHYAIEEWSG